MTDLSRVLLELAGILERMGLSHAVMGGIAVRAYGIPRPTYDVDFMVAIDRRQLPEFYGAVRELGYSVPDSYERGWVDKVAGMSVVKLRVYFAGHGVDIDVFIAESSYQRELLSRRVRQDLGSGSVWMASPEGLILWKLLAGRARDIADVHDVLFTQGQLDQ